MADKKPCDLVKIFVNTSAMDLEEDVNDWLRKNPEFYIDKMQFFVSEGTTSYTKYLVCNLCLREDLGEEEIKEDASLTEELLKGLIGAVNELTDTVKELTNKKENNII